MKRNLIINIFNFPWYPKWFLRLLWFETCIDDDFLRKKFLKSVIKKNKGMAYKKFGYKNSIKSYQKFPLFLIYEQN
jgi:hypothetical protein